MSGFDLLIFGVAIIAGAVASIAGFGIGSLLTPALATVHTTKLAVAAVAIPHFLGTALRFWRLRQHLDPALLRGFGAASAAGGLMGALLHARTGSYALRLVFGLLLLLASLSELSGLAGRVRLGRRATFAAGALSGLFGGMVGNQGGIRSAAMLTFSLRRDAFVATATAIALIVDAARLPVYLVVEGEEIFGIGGIVIVASAGVVIGTLAGEGVLLRVPEALFRRVVALLILALGLYMLFGAG